MAEIRIPFTQPPGRVWLAGPDELHAPVSAESDRHAEDMQMLQQLFGGLHASIRDLQNQQRQSLRELQQVAVELSSAVASWLTQTAIDRDLFNVQQLVADSIEHLGGGSSITVRLSPQDYELFTRQQQTQDMDLLLPNDVSVVSDASLPRGSCTAETQSISLVSDLETRLTSVRQTWLENLDDAQIERRTTGRDGGETGRVPNRRETA